MKCLLRFVISSVILGACALFVPSHAATVVVYVYNNQFSINPPGGPVVPAVITQGDFILWQHVQGGHTTTSVMGSSEQWDVPINSNNPTFLRQFNAPGVFWYYCIPHGADNMNGTASGMASTITVLTAGSGACCLPDGTCITADEGTCLSQSGTFTGVGSTCANTTCTTVVSIIANKDNILYQSATGTISNALGSHIYAGNNNAGIRRGIISFDLSTIPQNAVIESAELRLWCNNNSGASFPLTVHKVVQSWSEGTSQAGGNEGNGATALTGDVTWLHRVYNTQFWTNPGGTFDATPLATTNVNAQNTHFSWTSEALKQAVAHWLHMPGMNHGLILRGDENSTANTKRFSSRHVSTADQRPTLIVTYSIPPAGACCLPDGSCTEVTAMQCMMAGGNFQGLGTDCTSAQCSVVLTPYLDALPLPGVAVPTTGQAGGAAHYDMYVTEQFQTLHSELPPTRVWGYNGSYPGPTFEAFRDQLITVQWHNDLRVFETGVLRTIHVLPVDTCLHGPDMTGQVPVVVTHLHGGKVDHISDGQPELSFPPGESSEIYNYPNIQPAGTLWYHDHALGITRLNVMMGMAGLYNLRDADELALNLPSGEYEVPLVIQDKSFNADGTMRYPEMHQDHFFGDVLMVNGKVWPYFEVKQGKYRFRVVNGSNSRSYTLALSNGAHFLQIGSELGLLDTPVMLSELTLHPGERYDLVVDFAPFAPGTEIILTNSAPAPYPGFPGVGVIPNVMKFTVLPQTGYQANIPETLVTLPPVQPELAVTERIFELITIPPHDCGEHGHNSPIWTINGLMWDDITEFPVLNSYEIWTWHNQSGMSHPMHMHLVAFRVLHRQAIDDATGQPVGPLIAPEAHEKGWKDTVHSPPGYRTSVLAQFTGFTGLFPYHCHILEHEDHEMMRQFMVVEAVSGCTDPSSCNYNPDATIDDGSCTYPGCTDPMSCNYNPDAGCDDGSCEYISCADCAGVPFGNAYFDECDNCVGGNTGLEPCDQDCNGDWGGTAFIDECGSCAGGNTGIEPCAPCTVDGGVVESTSPRQNLCIGDGDPNIVQLTVSGNSGQGRFGIARQSDLQIVATNTTGTFNMENFPPQSYFAGYVAVNSLTDLAGVNNVNDLSGCYELSNFLTITTVALNGGTITANDGTTACGDDGIPSNLSFSVTGATGPNFRWAVLSQDFTTVLDNNTTGIFNFDLFGPGTYRVVYIRYFNVNIATIVPPTVPPCVAESNFITVSITSCTPSLMLMTQPNPTPGESNVSFTAVIDEWHTLEVYDMQGRLLKSLMNQVTQAGQEYRFSFDGSALPNGVYLYRLTTESDVRVEKFMIAR